MSEREERFFLSADHGEHWYEVTQDKWREAERASGFLPTGGFTSGAVSGTITSTVPYRVKEGIAKLLVDPAKAAEEFRKEYVCCDIYARMGAAYDPEDMTRYRELMRSPDYHAMCHYMSMAAEDLEEMARGTYSGS